MSRLKGLQPLPRLHIAGGADEGALAGGTLQGPWAGMPSTDRSLPGSPSTHPPTTPCLLLSLRACAVCDHVGPVFVWVCVFLGAVKRDDVSDHAAPCHMLPLPFLFWDAKTLQ